MITIKGHRVLLKVEKLQEVDEVYRSAHRAGIMIAEDHDEHRRAQASLDQGTVIAIGPDAWKAFHNSSNVNGEEFVPWCQVGDFIAFAKYSGKMLTDPEDKQKYIVINDEDVVAVLGGAKDGR
jgi:co-chaperonin GroES (HSP10)